MARSVTKRAALASLESAGCLPAGGVVADIYSMGGVERSPVKFNERTVTDLVQTFWAV